jgi:hypothetical protein
MSINNPEYFNSLEATVEEYKRRYPDRYTKAQRTGELVMENDHQSWQVGKDLEGERIQAEQLLSVVKNYQLTEQDLTPEEKQTLLTVYGEKWMEKC